MKDMMDIPNYDLIIIDAMNLCARMHNSKGLKHLSYEGHPTGMLFGVMRKVFQLQKAYPKAEVRFLWEGETSKRKAAYAHYKASRFRKDDDFRSCVDEVKVVLKHAGVNSMFHLGLEADDVAGYVSDTAESETRVLMISNDEDWIQYVKPNVDLQRSSGHGGESESDLADSLGFSPAKMGMWKILRGDKSDEIKGIHRIPSAVIRLLLNRCDSWEDFRSYPLSQHNPAWDRWEKAIDTQWDHLRENAELILYHPEWIVDNQIVFEYGERNEAELKKVFHRYAMKSLLEGLK